MSYKVNIKGDGKEIDTEVEDLKELKRLLEEYKTTDEIKVEKTVKIKVWYKLCNIGYMLLSGTMVIY